MHLHELIFARLDILRHGPQSPRRTTRTSRAISSPGLSAGARRRCPCPGRGTPPGPASSLTRARPARPPRRVPRPRRRRSGGPAPAPTPTPARRARSAEGAPIALVAFTHKPGCYFVPTFTRRYILSWRRRRRRATSRARREPGEEIGKAEERRTKYGSQTRASWARREYDCRA